MKSRIIVSAIIEKDGNLLFGRKQNNLGPYPNSWHLIGGGINLGEESLNEAIKREIREEANIEVELLEKVDFDEDYEKDKHGEITHYVFLVFLARFVSGDLIAKDDIVELKWVPKEELSKINLTRPAIKLFKKIGYLENEI